jgi:hypothetical protein
MSYSTTQRGKSKHEAAQRAKAALATQFAQMPEHARDAGAALASIDAHVAAVDEPAPDQEVVVECYGHLTGQWSAGAMTFCSGATHSVRVYHAPAQLPATQP